MPASKPMSKRALERLLAFYTSRILRRYRPTIIGVTGSVGKTSTKEAIFAVLQTRFSVRRNLQNYNNEIGVPLTVIGAPSGKRSLTRWLGVLLHATKLLLVRTVHYPALLVLEMGADRPGDIAYLTQLTPCTIGVLTAVGPAHAEFFGSIENVLREKSILVTHLPSDGLAVINADDERIVQLQPKIRASVLTFGFADRAMLRAVAPSFTRSESRGAQTLGLQCKIVYQGNMVPLFIPGVVGRHLLYSALAAAAVGLHFGMNLVDIAAALRQYQSPPGRMRLLVGIKQTTLIDDSYNASPASALAALATLAELPGFVRRIACLGDMTELGPYTNAGHADVGKAAAGHNLHLLVTVGPLGRKIADAARIAGMPEERVVSFDYAAEAGKFLQDRLAPNDLVLVKGSQAARMEKVVHEIMAEPERAGELLVRQDPSWQHRP